MAECENPYVRQLSWKDHCAGKVLQYYDPEDYDAEGNKLSPGLPCNRCRACKDRSRRRWVGRMLAEQRTSVEANFVTLTYGYDDYYRGRADRKNHPHPHANELHYDDVQKWIKRIRRAGHEVHYLVAGEFGDIKGRAHWHVALFWQSSNVPEAAYSEGRNWEDKFWPHGVVDWKPLNEAYASYICYYILPEADSSTISQEFRKSTKPALGHEYFESKALDWVKAGLAPQDSLYSFPEVVINRGPLFGHPKRFYMSTPLRDRFLRSFVRQWREVHGSRYIPNGEYVEHHLERVAKVALERERYRDLGTLVNLSETGSYYGPPLSEGVKRIRTGLTA